MFYRWYDQYQTGGPEALDDRSPRPDRVWNRIPDDVRSRVSPRPSTSRELRPRELAVRFTDAERYFVSEASVYRLLKAHDLITSPAFITMNAADEFKNKTTAPNQLWQTDFTYLKVTGWGWFYLSTILDDFSRYIIAWKLCTTMKAEDVTDTLKLALQASGLDQATRMHRPRLLSDNGSSYVSGDLAKWLERQDMRTYAWCALSSDDAGENRALASNAQEPHPARELLSARRSRSADRCIRRVLQPPALSRRASTISPRPTSTSGAVKPSCWKEKGSNARPSKTVGCFTTNKPRNITTMMRQTFLVQAAFCLKISDDGTGPAMADRTLDWRDELGRWLKPFLARLGHKARRQMCPLYVSGLIGPGDRKSIQPMAKRLALGACDQLHHFIAAGVWDVIDDTATRSTMAFGTSCPVAFAAFRLTSRFTVPVQG